MQHNSLINEATRQLASRFQPQPLDIKKRIESLIEVRYRYFITISLVDWKLMLNNYRESTSKDVMIENRRIIWSVYQSMSKRQFADDIPTSQA